jgi:transposase
MRVLKIEPHMSETDLKKALFSKQSINDFKDWQIIFSIHSNPGKKASEIATILCITENKVYKTVQKYNRLGTFWKSGAKRGGRRQARCYLTTEEEIQLMKSLEEDALSGNILIFRHIKERIEGFVGKEVSDDYIWDLFSRHDWSKKVPRKQHPKADKVAQEEYKKNSTKIWLPNH